MTTTEQARLATVEEHVRGNNARDMGVMMGTFSFLCRLSLGMKARVLSKRWDLASRW